MMHGPHGDAERPAILTIWCGATNAWRSTAVIPVDGAPIRINGPTNSHGTTPVDSVTALLTRLFSRLPDEPCPMTMVSIEQVELPTLRAACQRLATSLAVEPAVRESAGAEDAAESYVEARLTGGGLRLVSGSSTMLQDEFAHYEQDRLSAAPAGVDGDAAAWVNSIAGVKPSDQFIAADRRALEAMVDRALAPPQSPAGESALREENARLRATLERIATWCPNTGGRLYPNAQARAALGSAK